MTASADTASVAVQAADFDPGLEIAALGGPGVGAVASFVGVVRDGSAGDLAALELEHYPGMTERSLRMIAEKAAARWPLTGVRIVHRVGRLAVGERIVLAAAASAHRQAAFDACAFVMDFLKTDAPFWKREIRRDGAAEWVDARISDDAAKARWR